MRMGAALIGLAVAVALPVAAGAVTQSNFQLRSTEDLVALCDAKPSEGAMGTAAENFCHGFTQGAVSVRMEDDRANGKPRPFCFPTPAPARSTTIGEFVKWAAANPRHLPDRPAEGFFAFLGERFPCGK